MKSILITGASGGIGLKTCEKFYEAGYNIYGTSTTDTGLSMLYGFFPKGEFYKCNVKKVDDINKLFKNIKSLDILVNNAGIATRGKMEEIKLEDFKNVMDVNVIGPYLMMKNAIPIMKEQKSGKIINIISTVGTRECPYVSPYAASKHALTGLSHSVRDELLEYNILVSNIYPGATDTGFNLKGKEGLMNVQEVADAIYFVADRGDNAICDLYIYPKMEKRKP